MNKIKTIKIKNQDDTLSEETYTIAADAINIDMKNKNNLQEVVGDINAKQEGSIKTQLGNKIDKSSIENSLDSSRTDKVLSAKQGKILGDTLNKKTYYCKTIAEMVADNKLKNGDLVVTEGYYSANDGGAAEYLIRNIKSDDVNDGGSIHFLNNGLVAELIVKNNTINIKQLGARNQDKDNNKYDIVPYLQKYINILDKKANRIKLYIPSGIWYCSGYKITRKDGFDICGDFGFCINRADGTVITSLYNNQEYILQIGDSDKKVQNWNLENIIFSSADFSFREDLNCFVYNTSTLKTITGQVLRLLYAVFGRTDNLFFLYIKGRAFKMASCWEIYFGLMNFRHVSALNSSIFCIGTADKTLDENANITACTFEKMMFEAVHGDLIEAERACVFGNNHFGVINFEDYRLTSVAGETFQYTTYTDEILETFDDEACYHQSIFKLDAGSAINCVIDNLELNNVSYRYMEKNGNTYSYDTIMSVLGESASYNCIIGNISISGMTKDMRILRIPTDARPYNRSFFQVDSIANNTLKNFYFDVNYGYGIKCNAELRGANNNIPVLNGNAVAFNDMIYRVTTPSLFRDEKALNKTQLCVKITTSSNFKFLVSSQNILIRAKIPNGETASLGLIHPDQPSKYLHLRMLGTGSFENYTFDISSKFDIGDLIDFRLSNSDPQATTEDCLLDYYIAY